MLAKIRKTTLLQYPYGMSELRGDNPFSDFGAKSDVIALFAATEAAQAGAELVEVQPAIAPDYEPATEVLIPGAVTLTKGVWRETLAAAPKPPPSVNEIAQAARDALDASDRTLLRCVEDSKPVPQEWADYRKALRALIADPKAEVPQRPDYP